MWCPECAGEYRPGIEMCPVCEVALTESLHQESDEDVRAPGGGAAPSAASNPLSSSEFVELAHYQTENEAREARGQLKEARIPSEMIVRDAEGSGEGEMDEEYWIRVPETALGAAIALLGSQDSLSDDLCYTCHGPFDSDGTCPRCRV